MVAGLGWSGPMLAMHGDQKLADGLATISRPLQA
jgi:hypothetical protein